MKKLMSTIIAFLFVFSFQLPYSQQIFHIIICYATRIVKPSDMFLL